MSADVKGYLDINSTSVIASTEVKLLATIMENSSELTSFELKDIDSYRFSSSAKYLC
jgi:hypothetical protein